MAVECGARLRRSDPLARFALFPFPAGAGIAFLRRWGRHPLPALCLSLLLHASLLAWYDPLVTGLAANGGTLHISVLDGVPAARAAEAAPVTDGVPEAAPLVSESDSMPRAKTEPAPEAMPPLPAVSEPVPEPARRPEPLRSVSNAEAHKVKPKEAAPPKTKQAQGKRRAPESPRQDASHRPTVSPVAEQAVTAKNVAPPSPESAASPTPSPQPGRDGGATHTASSPAVVWGSPDGPAFRDFVPPVYPQMARRTGRQGAVLVELRLDAAGTLLWAEIVESGGKAFDAAALRSIRRSTYRPARINGVPRACTARVPVRFILKPARE